MEVIWKRQWDSLVWLSGTMLQIFFHLSHCCEATPTRNILGNIGGEGSNHGVRLLIYDNQVVMDNGIVQLTLARPHGHVLGIKYNGVENLLDSNLADDNRGYWDCNYRMEANSGDQMRFLGNYFRVVVQNRNQVELSFKTTWNSSDTSSAALNVEKRYIMLSNSSGFYAYAIYKRLQGWPAMTVWEARLVFKLPEDLFEYMAISDTRQRVMPTTEDREKGRSLDYPEAVLLTNPSNPNLKGEVDDKYQYSVDNKDNKVHGWISLKSGVGFWVITPSDEFRMAGPLKQDLTSHVGPTCLSMFMSAHYAGADVTCTFGDGEAWKKVFGPVFIYLNSVLNQRKVLSLWSDAKRQMLKEVESWPYSFPHSPDFPKPDQRGSITGRLVVHDQYIKGGNRPGKLAYVGLAAPGRVGSWQYETKGYQFWAPADEHGNFFIKGVRSGRYNLYAWVPGVLGDYMYDASITIIPGSEIKLGVLVFKSPRYGPTLWEIGIPDRMAGEFYVPDVNPKFSNRLYIKHDKYRQYGLWERYAELYPHHDLVYRVGTSDYRKDWFFAHVLRIVPNRKPRATTWRIVFDLRKVDRAGSYRLRITLAAADLAEVQVRLNHQNASQPDFSTGLIGRDNGIARHGIHGLLWSYTVKLPGYRFVNGRNTIFLTQPRNNSTFCGVMYDYIRLEGPPHKAA